VVGEKPGGGCMNVEGPAMGGGIVDEGGSLDDKRERGRHRHLLLQSCT
jgi:hypothetical protein